MTNKKVELKSLVMADLENVPDDLLTFKVSVLSQLLGRVVEASVSRTMGLSARQWRFLMTVHRVGTSTSGEIAQFSHLDYSQVSRAGAELLESGLVTYVIDKTDKRKSFVSLSAKGKRAIATGIANSMGRQDRLKGVMSPEEYKVFGRLLSSLTQEARAMLAEEKSKKE